MSLTQERPNTNNEFFVEISIGEVLQNIFKFSSRTVNLSVSLNR
jgi:hypothetical protein